MSQHVHSPPAFAHAMLLMSTADAAANHGLEDASNADAPPKNNGSFLVNSPLLLLSSYLRRPGPSSPSTTKSLPNPNGDTVHTPQNHVMTATTPHNASPAVSRPPSSSSSTAESRPGKRAPRSKTSYLIAKPVQPVKPRSKLHIRPKVLMQLHQVIASQHPKPVYELIPFSLLPQRSTRRFARTFNTRERLGPNDLLIIKAEDYSNKEEDARLDHEPWGSREVIGVISPGKSDKGVTAPTEICMDDGMSRWEVSLMPNGGYEFNTTDDHGLSLKARWVLKSTHVRRSSGTLPASPYSSTFPSAQDNKKFTFSTISSNSRRHPIIATMTRTRIDVLDSYVMPTATSPPTPIFPSNSSQIMTPSSIDKNSFLDSSSLALPIETDDALRRFIVVSGVWVAFQNLSALDNASPISLNTSATFRPPNSRSMSLIDSPRSASPASTVDENHRSLPKIFRTSIERLPRTASFTEPSLSISSNNRSSNASPVSKTRSRRANSTGAVQLHSMTGSLKNKYGLAFEDQALPESEEERQNKRSVELFRLNEGLLEAPATGKKPRPTLRAIPSHAAAPLSAHSSRPSTPHSAPIASSHQFSLASRDPERDRKTQSAFNPVTTTGLWDSGVTEGSRFRRNPTSMFVMNERKKKQEKKGARSKSKEKKQDDKRQSLESQELLGLRRKSGWYKLKFKLSIKRMLRREKS